LEDHVLNYARSYEHRISVFTGPILADDDPTYRGIQIPRRFWKIAAWVPSDGVDETTLRSAGFILDQGPSLDKIDLTLRADTPPPLGPFITYQAPIADIAVLTGLGMGLLTQADRLSPVPAARATERWNLLTRDSDIKL
jgi:endonuclease G